MSATTLFAWPIATPDPKGNTIEVIGVRSDAGNSIASGARLGPQAIRRASLNLHPEASGIDHGDIEGPQDDVLQRLEEAVEAIARRESVPLILGGDHAISYAPVAALRKRQLLNILWFDAHTDFCAWPNESWHNHKQVLRRIASLSNVGKIVQVGHRGITYFDEASRYSRITVIPAGVAARTGADAVLEQLPADEPLYMSIDIDALDPRWAAGTGHPVPGGLSVAQLADWARAIASRREIAGLDLMEVNPLLDRQDRTSAAAAAILAEIVPALMQYRSPVATASALAAHP